MQFSKLRLTGFKSFVDSTELMIEPGMTAVVGPNGCGKSNLVEALRWIMGEVSAKKMRGGEMNDVIFGGTAKRPARNVAEVSLLLQNTARDAPAQFNDDAEIEVTRRIERDQGSLYRINGREMRARDVQLLFADIATGAHSSALVSQGDIATIVRAKPAERRRLLEEAAGISGLHSRRHEAELKLRGAESNLERLDDVIAAFEAQLQGLKRQARQANRYRRLSGHIRVAQATLLHLRWLETAVRIADAQTRLGAAETTVAKLTRQAAAAATARADASEVLPGRRQAEAEAAAAFHRLEVERDGLAEEEARLTARRDEQARRIEQIAHDLAREKTLESDAAEAMAGLTAERTSLARSEEDDAAAEQAGEALDAAQAALAEVEDRFAAMTETIASREAERMALVRRQAEAAARYQRLNSELEEIAAESAELERPGADRQALRQAETSLADARARRDGAREKLEAGEIERTACESAERTARDGLQAAETLRDRLRAEEAALASILETGSTPSGPPVFDDVHVDAGFEAALGAAFGDELSASTDESAPIHWVRLAKDASLPALPAGARPLSEVVQAPPALARRLSHVGIVERGEGAKLRRALQPGQCLVSRDGALWRWDGYTVAAEAPVASATRLRQRNRLIEVRDQLTGAEAAFAAAGNDYAPSQSRLADARRAEDEARAANRVAENDFSQAQELREAELEAGAAARSRLEALADTARRLGDELAEAGNQQREAEAAREEMAELDAARAERDGLRGSVTERRSALAEAQATQSRVLRELQIRADRLAAVDRESELWQKRGEEAAERLGDLDDRRQASQTDLDALAERPAELEAHRASLLESLETAEARRRDAADALAGAEAEASRLDAHSREADQALAVAREERVRVDATVDQAREAQAALTEQIAEKLDAEPDELPAIAELGEGDELPAREKAETRVERLLRERDTMGPVNLRAEAEAAETEEQIATLRSERADLEAAIGRLHQGIASLNREGRERINSAFTEIDGHFRRLFAQLFGGGTARLELVESDDPLEAGLELIATPPGKQTRVLSLLSGGEQALTALTLLFAVFLTNPAPICVLDEADAPLDDANVERFCDLIESIARDTGTRFLVITHNRITMTRVDRLFGVTMSERGVSQLVSVDLGAAEQLRESA